VSRAVVREILGVIAALRPSAAGIYTCDATVSSSGAVSGGDR
jgi:hypothetical protein